MRFGQNTSLISVYGVGNIKIQANLIKIFIKVNQVSKTINEAQTEVNKKIKILLKILNELSIVNINTGLLTFSPKYEWKKSEYKLTGQEVEQELIVTITDLKNNMQKAKDLLDKITLNIESMNCRVHFGIDNYEEKFTEARNLAYSKALEKAEQYAKSAKLKIIKTVKISEYESGNNSFEYEKRRIFMRSENVGMDDDSTELPLSDLNIETKLFCDFLAR